jgi:hypothetical protein
MDVAVGNHLGAIADHVQNHNVGAFGIDALARAQRPIHDDGIGQRRRHLDLHFANDFVDLRLGAARRHGIGGCLRPRALAACIWASLPLRTATGTVRWLRRASIRAGKSISVCFAYLAEVDQHGVVVEEVRVVGKTGQILRQRLHVGAAKHHGAPAVARS